MGSIMSREFIKPQRVSILLIFVGLGLLRLTNFNFYLSRLVGFETTINATGGDAYNFINYIIPIVAGAIFLGYWRLEEVNWRGSVWYVLLITLYVLNAGLAPYVNSNWVFYQLVFISVGWCLHVHVVNADYECNRVFSNGLSILFWLGILFAAFSTGQILLHVSPGVYFSEFNDSFVQTLDDYGIMKQRYGYLMGFLFAYAIFLVRDLRLKVLSIGMIWLSAFGIRSFLLGVAAASLIYLLRQPKKLLTVMAMAVFPATILIKNFFQQGIYDTRFYPYLNAWDIVQNYPFGLGLGGYPSYTEDNSRQLLAMFYDVNSVLDFVPTAPESDIVHLFGSLGLVLGGLHLMIIGKLIWKIILRQGDFSPLEKCFSFYFVFMTFYGLSEDSIFSINYWVFFGITTGIITRHSLDANKTIDGV